MIAGIQDYQHKYCEKTGDKLMALNRYHSDPFGKYLDHMLYMLMIEPIDEICPHTVAVVEESLTIWEEAVRKAYDDGFMQWFDYLGHIYEYCASNSKKSAFGQFFTPAHLCDMMAEMQMYDLYQKDLPKDRPLTIGDPTAGSSRMLLAAAAYWFNSQPPDSYRYLDNLFMVANDLDYKCAKMSVINFVLHGLTGEITCADGLWMQNDYRFGYQVQTIPTWKYCMKMYNTLVVEIQEGVRDSYIKDFLQQAGSKENAIFHLRTMAEACKIGKHYDQAMPVVKHKIMHTQMFSELRGKMTIYSPAGSEHVTIIHKISEDESIQVQGERAAHESWKKEDERKKMELKGSGLFSDVKINQNVIKVKKSKLKPEEAKAEEKKIKKKKKPPFNSGGEQISLF